MRRIRVAPVVLAVLCLNGIVPAKVYDVRDYGAVGDGKAVDSPAINKAIDAAAAVGGGTVHLPAGQYLGFSIRLKSNITLHLDQGATLIAATPGDLGGYDDPEPNPWGDKHEYQDFGHRGLHLRYHGFQAPAHQVQDDEARCHLYPRVCPPGNSHRLTGEEPRHEEGCFFWS